jgi:hypothetical protein
LISIEIFDFNFETDDIGAKLLATLDAKTVIKAFSLQKSAHRLSVENIQTFLFRALFYLVEYSNFSEKKAAVMPTQQRIRAVNEMRFNVTFEAGEKLVGAPLLLRRADIVEKMKAMCNPGYAPSSTSTAIVTAPVEKTATSAGAGAADVLQLSSFMESLRPEQLRYFEALKIVPSASSS